MCAEITCRRATLDDAAAIAAVHVQAWHETYRGHLPDAYIDARSLDQRIAIWQHYLSNGGAMYVACDNGAVIGFMSMGTFKDEPVHIKGEIPTLYILASHHRRGIGKQLFELGRQHLTEQGLLPFGIWVLATNPARHFYTAMGGRHEASREEIIEGEQFTDWLFIFD